MTTIAKRDELDIGIDMSDMLVLMMVLIMASLLSSISGIAASSTQQLQAQAYVGLTDSRTLHATQVLQWINLISDPPYTAWITASFHNNGPDSAFVSINNPDEFTEIANGEDIAVSMAGADRRIEFVFYKSNLGERASIRALGKY